MKRALLVSTGTVAGLVTVLVLNPTTEAVLTATASSSVETGAGSADSGPTDSGSTDSGSTDSGSGGSGSTDSGSGGAAMSGTYEGDTITTRWGPVQVQAVVEGGTLTDVRALQLPSGDHRSYQISVQVEPVLREQALAAQSAALDGVSGATYTSQAYAQSLASALDRAGL